MIEVGTFSREIAASAELFLDDELDWEHLPHTHRFAFSAVERIRADDSGWEGEVTLREGPTMRMRVTVDADRRGFVNATFDADGTENGRTVAAIAPIAEDRCRVDLRFFAPATGEAEAEAAGRYYAEVWDRILAEDEVKLTHRAAAVRAGPAALRLRRPVRLADGTACEVPVFCPHQGLPLEGEPDAEGILTCPWHGYRFDARTGACVSGQIRGWRTEA